MSSFVVKLFLRAEWRGRVLRGSRPTRRYFLPAGWGLAEAGPDMRTPVRAPARLSQVSMEGDVRISDCGLRNADLTTE